MKSKISKIHMASRTVALAAFIGIALSVTESQAQLAQPSAIAQFTLADKATEIFGMPFVRPVVTKGKITAATVAGNSLSTTFTVTLDAGETSIPALNSTSDSVDEYYILEITDGPGLGFILPCTGNNGNTSVTVQGTTGTTAIPENTSFVIRKDNTLSSVFGAPSSNHPFGAGISSSDAKVWVQVYNSGTATLTSYYVYQNGATLQWRSTSGPTNRTFARVTVGKAVVLASREKGAVTFTLSGDYRTARTRLWVQKGKITFLANPAPVDSSFDEANIPDTTPTRFVGTANQKNVGDSTSSDEWKVWVSSTRTFANYYIGTDASNFPGIIRPGGLSNQNPTIKAFSGVGVKPIDKANDAGYTIVTMAPKL